MSGLDLSLLDNDGGSWDELCAAIGIDLPDPTRPGDRFAPDVEAQLYWPRVTPPAETDGAS